MSRIRSVSKMERDSAGEVRKIAGCPLVHQPSGLRRYGCPDFANKTRRIMVFVHGSFWHGYGYPSRFRMPQTNAVFWADKILRNRARHRQVVRRARKDGWTVITVWDFQLKRRKP